MNDCEKAMQLNRGLQVHVEALREKLARAEAERDEARRIMSCVSSAGHQIDYDGWTSAMEQIEKQRLRAEKESAAFKNFHRLLCERFRYGHDEEDWRRDQLSLIEHIATLIDASGAELQNLKLATLAALTQAGIAMLEENPITPSEVKSAIRRLASERDSSRVVTEEFRNRLTEWHKTAHECALLRGLLIEFWEATAGYWKDPDRLEAARVQLMATAGHLVARKEKGELV